MMKSLRVSWATSATVLFLAANISLTQTQSPSHREKFSSLSDLESSISRAYQDVVSTQSYKEQDGRWLLLRAPGDTLPKCTLIALRNDSLAVGHQGEVLWFPVESLAKLIYRKSRMGLGIGIGAVAGAVIGGAVGSQKEQHSGQTDWTGLNVFYSVLGGAALGVLAGGITGNILSVREVYDLSGKSAPEKIEVIQFIMAEGEK